MRRPLLYHENEFPWAYERRRRTCGRSWLDGKQAQQADTRSAVLLGFTTGYL